MKNTYPNDYCLFDWELPLQRETKLAYCRQLMVVDNGASCTTQRFNIQKGVSAVYVTVNSMSKDGILLAELAGASVYIHAYMRKFIANTQTCIITNSY